MVASWFHLIVASVAVHTIGCHSMCPRQSSLEWHPKQQTIQVNWTLVGNLCSSSFECWGIQPGEESAELFSFPQMCPLRLQHGDALLMWADDTLRSYGIRLVNVSQEDFQSCSTTGEMRDQFHFPRNASESQRVEEKWLVPGRHYFIAAHGEDAQLCKLGLRLNVSVKAQLCQASPLLRLCSGNGVCQTGPGESVYRCRCRHRHSGTFCEKSDPCLDNPCENKGVCLSNGSADPNHTTYKCLCPPHFTGEHKNYSTSIQQNTKSKIKFLRVLPL